MDEAILDAVELIDVLIFTKCWIKSASANGNPKANVAVDCNGLGGEQRTEV